MTKNPVISLKVIDQISEGALRLSFLRIGLLIFAISLVVRLAIIAGLHPYEDLTRYELERTALSLASTGVYGNPYAIPTGPTAHVSPGYTLLLATIFRVFGHGVSAELVKECLSCIVTSLGFALLPVVAQTCLQDRRSGVVAGLICAIFPWKPLVQVDGDWETPYTALFLTVIAVITVDLWRRKKLRWTNCVYHGAVWGLALLFASVLLPVFFGLMISGIYFFRGESFRRYLAFSLAEALLVAACLTPWILRNERALGSPIATRSNLGLELRVSNNDDASPDQRTNLVTGVYDKYHPFQNVAEAQEVRTLGEVAYNRRASALAIEWMQAHPARFIQLCFGRIKDFWFYPDPSRMKALFGYLTAILGLAGLIHAWGLQPETGIVLTNILLFYSAPSYLIHVGARQRYPIDWILVLLSVLFVKTCFQTLARRRSSKVFSSRPQPLPAAPSKVSKAAASLRDNPVQY